ncbi:hypothetical protein EV586_101209 [Tumebacillus sp. BK434]|uniref:hypothetical protein n=1 Tax=Tumebacillus sp. BK434 TaxID=2512169 RepID=UPI001046656D|nr:hypothetical protein [Tumebacillus sp. BK434]TCP59010.1 hypothetical protein EV586_101209 [Tumebacillus sp. BK434]
MQKSRFYPFERNRYFYGKLLTVRDFESEQTYFNDKRRLLNRLLYGTGVIAGMQVVKVDERSFSLQAGVALDHLGREIVVPEPQTYNLSVVPGFVNNGEYSKYVYLCIAYDEKGKEPVFSIANTTVRKDEVNEYNRMFEGYKVFVREQAPELSAFEHHNLAHTTKEVLAAGGIRILHQVPRYVQAGSVFEAKVIVEKALQTSELQLEFELMTKGCDAQNGNKLAFKVQGKSETRSEFTYQLRAHDTPGHDATVAILPEGSMLMVGNEVVKVSSVSIQNIELAATPARERILDEYFARSLDKALESDSDPCLYLAKIHLQQVGAVFMIDRIETVPFGDHIYNHSLLTNLGLDKQPASPGAIGGAAAPNFSVNSVAERLPSDADPKLDVAYDPSKQEFTFTLGVPEGKPGQGGGGTTVINKGHTPKTAAGMTDILLFPNQRSGKINPFGKAERTYYSDEIEHGLGVGNVFVQAGIEECDSLLNQGDAVYYGDQDVFTGSDHESFLPKTSLGVLVYPKKGTFRIGLKLHGSTEMSKLRVRWWAMQDPDEQAVARGRYQSEAASADDEF